jgi:CheY-like chemotaxis protein
MLLMDIEMTEMDGKETTKFWVVLTF